ncbi:hypothetical protein BGZ58_003846 [Dissophora ornata]|nr:hypothetical protein BGZ58_003846 [Dissophora ornata]
MGPTQSNLAQGGAPLASTRGRSNIEPLSRQLSQLSLESYDEGSTSDSSCESFEEVVFEPSEGLSDWGTASAPPSPTSPTWTLLYPSTQQGRCYEMRVPVDVWARICSYLYPSQLARLSLVNKAAYGMVTGLEIWSLWYKRLHGPPRKRALPMKPISDLSASHSYMLYMCAISFQVCEKCFRQCDGKRQRGRLAAMPLAVELSSPALEVSNEQVHGDVTEERVEWTIRLCKGCRVAHFEIYPEPMPEEVATSFLLKRTIKEKYRLGDREIRAISVRSRGDRKSGKPVIYSEQAALTQARRSYGGDVGRAAVPQSLCRLMKVLNNRVFIYNLRRRIVDGGQVWLPCEEYQSLKAARLLRSADSV